MKLNNVFITGTVILRKFIKSILAIYITLLPNLY